MAVLTMTTKSCTLLSCKIRNLENEPNGRGERARARERENEVGAERKKI